MSARLRGIRVHLAGSVPEKSAAGAADGIRSFAEALAAEVLREGGTLVHGSHPSLKESLKSAAQRFVAAGGPKESLTLVRSHTYATPEHAAEITAQREFASVQIIPGIPGSSDEGLVTMREWMVERSDVIVAVGGNWGDVNKERAGVYKELNAALSRGKPVFLIAGFGGAIKDYIDDHPAVWFRLRNGLPESGNRALATDIDAAILAKKIVTQIALLPLVRDSVPGGRNFRILSLDGGGIRGVFTSAVLSKWNDMLQGAGGKHFIKHFDMVAGTSTGAILAIGLGLGLVPNQILKFYRDKGRVIFPGNRQLRHWFRSKYESQTLRQALHEVFGDRKLSTDSVCRLVIPTVRAVNGESEVITTAHSLDRSGFADISAIDAALASSAAPSYFDEAHIDDKVANQHYLDGGIWANNPVLPAIAEAVRHLEIPLDRIDVLSVGTLGNESDFSNALGDGKLGWAPSTADLFFAAQEHAASAMADGLLTRARHLRVNQQTPTPILLDNVSAIEDMARRGDNVGKDSFSAVRSRFLDGFHTPDWRQIERS
jgi:predicted acylesterase/phospholipase RssA